MPLTEGKPWRAQVVQYRTTDSLSDRLAHWYAKTGVQGVSGKTSRAIMIVKKRIGHTPWQCRLRYVFD